MRQAEAAYQIVDEFRTWARANLPADKTPSGMDGLMFFVHIQKAKPDLLNFKAHGDKWQYVHGWLLRSKVVGD